MTDKVSSESLSDDNEIIALRLQKLHQWRQQELAFPNDFSQQHLASELLAEYSEKTPEALTELAQQVSVAGRIMLRRVMGKASFLHIQDGSGERIQLYVRKNDLIEGDYQQFTTWDLGDIIGARGELFKTKTGELTVKVTHIRLLSKALSPLPDKFHGLHDREACYRKRYVDLLVNPNTRRTFMIRSQLIAAMRRFMVEHQFLEVETPMLHPIAGGALARPFTTHHNTLHCDMYLRIAPELYLKRLIVGGFDRVFEINRNFRNEGISTQHNPEFTMMEFYQAYATYRDLIPFTEKLFRFLAENILGQTSFEYQGNSIDFTHPFACMSMQQAILQYNPDVTLQDLNDIKAARALADNLHITLKNSYCIGKIQTEIFEKKVEARLISPTFITDYPTEVSPLARCHSEQTDVPERFELFIAGREIANGFSELNDPEDQAERFQRQAKERSAGDVEAMSYDEDYIEALEYAMPPTAGEGIGIDRLVMLFTNAASIRDVILFPQLRAVE